MLTRSQQSHKCELWNERLLHDTNRASETPQLSMFKDLYESLSSGADGHTTILHDSSLQVRTSMILTGLPNSQQPEPLPQRRRTLHHRPLRTKSLHQLLPPTQQPHLKHHSNNARQLQTRQTIHHLPLRYLHQTPLRPPTIRRAPILPLNTINPPTLQPRNPPSLHPAPPPRHPPRLPRQTRNRHGRNKQLFGPRHRLPEINRKA